MIFGSAPTAATARDDGDDLEAGIRERGAMGAHLEAEPERVGRDAGELSDFESDDRDASVSDLLGDRVDHTFDERELVHSRMTRVQGERHARSSHCDGSPTMETLPHLRPDRDVSTALGKKTLAGERVAPCGCASHLLTMQARGEDVQRRGIRIRGIVQGVGFRPAMYRLAGVHGLTGFVFNDREGVWLEIEGSTASLDRFVAELATAAPPASRIDRVEIIEVAPRAERAFRIAETPRPAAGIRASAAIPADLAPCAACIAELLDPSDRRYRYPFINCTACGPRFTIIRDVPYDRSRTTMAGFTMCAACAREYDDPADRRFHAEPNACQVCGPQVWLVGGDRLETGDAAVRDAAAALVRGAIVAVKGAGGFVLAVDARNDDAVARLRERKHRPHKPFAVMGRSIDELEQIVTLDNVARAELASPSRPIVLAPGRGGLVAQAVAPGLRDLGVYLPPTPLQHLLLADGPSLQVMTSGNLADEPIARTNAEAFERLATVADVFLVHDRDIHARADDSVIRRSYPGSIPMRRSRGFVPDTIALVGSGPVILAVGGHSKNTVCLARDGQAILSQHVGDLDHLESSRFFDEAVAHLSELARADPEVVAHDLHPDYRSTRWALASGLPRVAVQHHHAHVASCLAEHGRIGVVTGVAFDGTGLGTDGTLWGGEILAADLSTSRRLGHLRGIALLGGEMAIRDPWRTALAALVDSGLSPDVLNNVPARARGGVLALLATDLAPRATSAGRWFDAVAALLGVAREISYDGQAAAQLEALAGIEQGPPFEIGILGADPFEIDLRPAIRELVHELRRDTSRAVLAARFHMTLAVATRAACRRVGMRTVVLTGGCFQNRRLLELTTSALVADGFEVLSHRRVPPNDGGLALGQAAVAAFTRRSPCV